MVDSDAAGGIFAIGCLTAMMVTFSWSFSFIAGHVLAYVLVLTGGFILGTYYLYTDNDKETVLFAMGLLLVTYTVGLVGTLLFMSIFEPVTGIMIMFAVALLIIILLDRSRRRSIDTVSRYRVNK